MATPSIRIDQPTPGVGTTGLSRDDLITGENLTFTDTANGSGTSWELFSVPPGSAAVIIGPTIGASVTVGPIDLPGTYLMKATNGADVSGTVDALSQFISTQGGAGVKKNGERIPSRYETQQFSGGWDDAMYSTLDNLLSGGGDAAAIHDNVAAEISLVAEKVAPVSADLLLIEDSADSNNKKRVQIGNLPTGSDADAIHDNVAGEISLIAEKVTPVSADLIIIEDSAASNAKKRVQIGNLPGGSGLSGGTIGRLARWIAADNIGNSLWAEDGSGNLTAGGSLLMNDEVLALDVDADTAFVVNGDDNVDFALGGTDVIRWRPATPRTDFIRSALVDDATGTGAVRLTNETAATSPTPRQNSPAIEWIGAAWDGTVSDEVRFAAFADAVDAATTVQGVWTLVQQMSGGATTTVFSVNQAGDATIAGDLVVSGTLMSPLVSGDATADFDLDGVAELILDADGDSKITATTTDDRIDINAGGFTRVRIDNNGLEPIGSIRLEDTHVIFFDADADSSISPQADDDVDIRMGGSVLINLLTNNARFLRSGLGTGHSVVLAAENETAATAGVTTQNSPSIDWSGQAWDNVATASEEIRFGVYVDAVNVESGNVEGYWTLFVNQSGAGNVDIFRISHDGKIAFDADFDTTIDSTVDDTMVFTTGAATRMTLDNTTLLMAVDVDLNGTERLVLDADADSYIEAVVDDRIDVYTLATLALRLNASQQVLAGTNGGAGAPAFAFDGNTAMGLYRAGNTVGLAGNGAIAFAAAGATSMVMLNTALYPQSSGSQTLGRATEEWGTLYLQDEASFAEMGTAPTGVTDKALVFAEDNGSGKTRLMVQFQTGSAIQLAIEV